MFTKRRYTNPRLRYLTLPYWTWTLSLKPRITGATSGSLKLQCIAIATFCGYYLIFHYYAIVFFLSFLFYFFFSFFKGSG